LRVQQQAWRKGESDNQDTNAQPDISGFEGPRSCAGCFDKGAELLTAQACGGVLDRLGQF
jgi:hypothetical protein